MFFWTGYPWKWQAAFFSPAPGVLMRTDSLPGAGVWGRMGLLPPADHPLLTSWLPSVPFFSLWLLPSCPSLSCAFSWSLPVPSLWPCHPSSSHVPGFRVHVCQNICGPLHPRFLQRGLDWGGGVNQSYSGAARGSPGTNAHLWEPPSWYCDTGGLRAQVDSREVSFIRFLLWAEL